jgi:hypothetical protein
MAEMAQWTSTPISSRAQVQEFADIADPLVFMISIIEKKTPEAVEKEAIRRIIAVAKTKQSNLSEHQKSIMMDMNGTIQKSIEKNEEVTVQNFSTRLADAYTMPTGPSTPIRMAEHLGQALAFHF